MGRNVCRNVCHDRCHDSGSFWILLALGAALAGAGACQKGPPPAPAPAPAPEAAPAPAPTAAPDPAAPPTPATAPAPAEIVDRAIAAAGGREALQTKLAAMTLTSTGTYAGAPYEMTTWWKAPDRMVMDVGGRMAMGHVGSDCWSKIGDVVVDCPPAEAAAAREMLFVGHLSNLYGLKEPGVTLAPAEPATIEGRAALGVVATAADGPLPVTLYFDAESWRLVALRFRQSSPGGPVASELFLSGHRPFDGVTIPCESRMTLGGQLLVEETMTGAELGVADEAKFQRPAQAPLGQPRTAHWPAGTCATTTVTGPYEGIGPAMGRLFGWIQSQKLLPMGPPVLIYRKGPGDAADPAEFVTEILVGVGVLGPQPPVEGDPAVKQLPERDVVVRLEQGPFDQMGARYGELAQWAVANGWEIVGPAGMISYSDPSTVPPAELLSEIWFPVRRK